MNFFHRHQHSMFYTCTCMHSVQDDMYGHVSIRRRPGRLQTWAATWVKRVDMQYLDAYTEGGRNYRLLWYWHPGLNTLALRRAT